jgi:glucosamine-6-phosphate deaminase
MDINIANNPAELGLAAAKTAADLIRAAIAQKGTAHIIMATGASQFETIHQLIQSPGINWSKVVMYHLDEYIGLPAAHPASFRKYLQERFLAKLPALKAVYLVDGETDPVEECARLNKAISQVVIDVALVGIGENGHLAFNDPPADFFTETPFIVVTLDELCRQQQLGEGWFNGIDEVPLQAISMSIQQIMKSTTIICSVPDSRKALAVKNTLQQEVSNLYPASILQTHGDCRFYLDAASAALLSGSATVST